MYYQDDILYCLCKQLLYTFLRSIKRKKFDDELVESSLVKSSSRVKGPPVIEPVRCSGSEPSSSEKKKVDHRFFEGLISKMMSSHRFDGYFYDLV